MSGHGKGDLCSYPACPTCSSPTEPGAWQDRGGPLFVPTDRLEAWAGVGRAGPAAARLVDRLVGGQAGDVTASEVHAAMFGPPTTSPAPDMPVAAALERDRGIQEPGREGFWRPGLLDELAGPVPRYRVGERGGAISGTVFHGLSEAIEDAIRRPVESVIYSEDGEGTLRLMARCNGRRDHA